MKIILKYSPAEKVTLQIVCFMFLLKLHILSSIGKLPILLIALFDFFVLELRATVPFV